jgi:hypothetical protein
MILSLEKIVNYESGRLALGKVQGTINGGIRCKLMVGCNSKHC